MLKTWIYKLMADNDAAFFHATLSRILASGGVQSVLQTQPRRVTAPAKTPLVEQCPRVIICLRGTGKYLVFNKDQTRQWTIKKHEAIYIPPNSWVQSRATTTYESLGVIFLRDITRLILIRCNDALRKDSSFPFNLNQKNLLWPRPLDKEGSFYIRKMAASPAPLLRRGILNLLLAWTLRCLELSRPQDRGKGHATWMAAMAFVEDHLHLPISRKEVARDLRLHPNHVSRLFTRYGTRPFADYVTNMRMERAQMLLKASRYNIAEIAARCGFSNSGYFSTVCLKEFGKTPSAIRADYYHKSAKLKSDSPPLSSEKHGYPARVAGTPSSRKRN
jgi:AraC-like DNA-binding protein